MKSGAAAEAAAGDTLGSADDRDDSEGSDDDGALEDYERLPRVIKAHEGPRSRGLPIKTLEGALAYAGDKEVEEGGDIGTPGQRRNALEQLQRASQTPQVQVKAV